MFYSLHIARQVQRDKEHIDNIHEKKQCFEVNPYRLRVVREDPVIGDTDHQKKNNECVIGHATDMIWYEEFRCPKSDCEKRFALKMPIHV